MPDPGVRGGNASFDFNVLPLSVIERVEILGMAPSIYGSDAVAGAVNGLPEGDGGRPMPSSGY